MNQTDDEVLDAITTKIITVVGESDQANRARNTIDPHENLIDSAGLDSVGLLETLVWLEERFDVQIPDEELNIENFATIAQMVDFVRASSPAV